MSVYDEFRALAGGLFDAFEAPVVTITRTTPAPRSVTDRAQGKAVLTNTTISARAVLGSRKVRYADGTFKQEAIARVDTPIQDGDKITIGACTFEVVNVEEKNPAGEVTAFVYVASLK